MARSSLAVLMTLLIAACFSATFVFAVGESAGRKSKKAAKQARRELSNAAKLLKAKRYDQGIARLEKIVASYPQNDRSTKRAKKLLLEYGVGKEIRVRLIDRGFFRKKLKMKDRAILKSCEDALVNVRQIYQKVPRFFRDTRLEMLFYDSEARFNEQTGQKYFPAHFEPRSADYEARTFDGKFHWHFPTYANTLRDRKLIMQSIMYHELAHYCNWVHFAGSLPIVLDEGLASYIQSRLHTEYYQYFRQTEKQRMESDARNGLSQLAKYPQFVKFLDSVQGFGRVDESLRRWYGLSYAVVDYTLNGKVKGKKVTLEKLMRQFAIVVHAHTGETTGRVTRMPQKATLANILRALLGVSLEEFHQGFVKYILANYRQM